MRVNILSSVPDSKPVEVDGEGVANYFRNYGSSVLLVSMTGVGTISLYVLLGGKFQKHPTGAGLSSITYSRIVVSDAEQVFIAVSDGTTNSSTRVDITGGRYAD